MVWLVFTTDRIKLLEDRMLGRRWINEKMVCVCDNIGNWFYYSLGCWLKEYLAGNYKVKDENG